MQFKQNLHTHTTYVDGKDTPRELVLEALARGFSSLGFSEHSYLSHSTYPGQLTMPKMAAYREEIAALKEEYRGIIELFCGLEYDFYSEFAPEGFDYLIGSVHYLDCTEVIATFDRDAEHTREFVRRYFGGDALAFAKCYYETLSRLPEKARFDIIGHFDLIAKHNDTLGLFDVSSKEYRALAFDAIHALRGKIPFFEVNTGALAAGYKRTPYPDLALVQELHRSGFGAVITSDCHNKLRLDACFDEAAELLRAGGFSTHFVLTENGFREVPL